MTFDLYRKGADRPGFHVNNWGWRPIARAIELACLDERSGAEPLSESELEGFRNNEHWWVNASRAHAIAWALEDWLERQAPGEWLTLQGQNTLGIKPSMVRDQHPFIGASLPEDLSTSIENESAWTVSIKRAREFIRFAKCDGFRIG